MYKWNTLSVETASCLRACTVLLGHYAPARLRALIGTNLNIFFFTLHELLFILSSELYGNKLMLLSPLLVVSLYVKAGLIRSYSVSLKCISYELTFTQSFQVFVSGS